MTGDGWRSDRLAQAVAQVEAELERSWAELRTAMGVAAGSAAESDLAQLVVDAPAEHDWRVVDAALSRLTCPECGAELPTGPLTCVTCTRFTGFRFGARETDRPGRPPGNEHAIRVSSAVARSRERYTPRARVGYELFLPDVLEGGLPSTPQAQAAKAKINKLTAEECDRVTTMAEVDALVQER